MIWTGWAMMGLMRLRILVAGELVHWRVIDARRNFAGVCSRWRPDVLVLHRFFIAISRAVVNHDGDSGTSIDLVSPPEVFLRGVRLCMRLGIGPFFSARPGWYLGWSVGCSCCHSYYLSTH